MLDSTSHEAELADRIETRCDERPSAPDGDAFRRFAGSWASGVAVVTTADRSGRPLGLTMSAVTSLSLVPQQFLICVGERSDTLRAMEESGVFCIHILRDDQQEISRRFAGKSPDKFAGVRHRRAASGAPVIEGALGHAECRVLSMMPGGDHRIVIGAVLRLASGPGEPLLHFQGAYQALSPIPPARG